MKKKPVLLLYSLCFILLIIGNSCFFDSGGSDSENNGSNTTGDTPSTDFFRDDFNGSAIDSTVWQVATWLEENQTGAERCYVKDGCLNLVLINDSVEGFLSAAIQTRTEYLYGKWEARLKPSNVTGILNSMYTIDWDDMSTANSGDDGTHQEIDIEFLTKSFSDNNGEIHYAVHATGKTSYNLNPDLSLGFNPSANFHIYAIEITPECINWYIDNVLHHTYNYSSGNIIINGPYQFKFNVWTQNGGWVGGPPVANTECIYQIDWVQFTPYND